MLRVASMHILTTLLLMALTHNAWAGTTGKIIGTVTDSLGRPIIAAACQVIDTKQGASATIEGQYVILGVMPGMHRLKFSSLGYETKIVDSVMVEADKATVINAVLQEVDLTPKPKWWEGPGRKERLIDRQFSLLSHSFYSFLDRAEVMTNIGMSSRIRPYLTMSWYPIELRRFPERSEELFRMQYESNVRKRVAESEDPIFGRDSYWGCLRQKIVGRSWR